MPRKIHSSRIHQEERDLLFALDPHPSTTTKYNHGSQSSSSTQRRTSSSSSSPEAWATTSSSTFKRSSTPFITKIPSEILLHVFSFLDPRSFASATLVSHEWYHVASDDYAWKAAFERFYGTHEVIPRLSASWRGEYIHRSHLLRKWQVGRGPVSFYDSGLYSLTHMSPLPALQKRRQSLSKATGTPLLLLGSAAHGLVKASDPATGQVFGVPTGYTWRATTSLALHNNVAAVGQTNGQVSVIDVSNRRKLYNGHVVMRGRHDIAVSALHILPVPIKVNEDAVPDGSIVGLISGDLNGLLLMHDIRTGICCSVHPIPDDPLVPDFSIFYVDYHVDTDLVIVGTHIGEIYTCHPFPDREDLTRVAATKYNKDGWTNDQAISVDDRSQAISLAVDVFYLSDMKNDSMFVIREKSLVRFGITNPSTTSFGNRDRQYTCAAIDPDEHDLASPRFLAVGDTDGTVTIFNARATLNEHQSSIPALYILYPTLGQRITAVALNPITILTGSADGTAKAYHTLDGSYIRSICAPTSRRRHLRPPEALRDDDTNPISGISLTLRPKHEVRGAIAFRSGSVRYWNYAPDGVGGVIKSKKRGRPRATAKEIKTFVDDEIERDVQESFEEEGRRRQWEKMNGGIEEEDVALQVALMMSREEEDRRREFTVVHEDFPLAQEDDESEAEDNLDWLPGRKISFGSTSGTSSPAVRSDTDRRLEDLAVFRRAKQVDESSQFDEDLDFAIRLSLAEHQSREESVSLTE